MSMLVVFQKVKTSLYKRIQIAYQVIDERVREGIVKFAVDWSSRFLKRGILGSPNIWPGAGGTMPASRSGGDILIKLTPMLWSSGHEIWVWLDVKLSPTVLFCLTEFSKTNTRHAGAVDGYESRGSISASFRETQDPQMFVIKTSISSHRVPCGTSVHFPWLFCISKPQSLPGAGPQ